MSSENDALLAAGGSGKNTGMTGQQLSDVEDGQERVSQGAGYNTTNPPEDVVAEEIEDSKTLEEKDEANASSGPKAWRLAIFTTFPLFMGYAGMIVLQAHIKRRLDIPKSGPRADVFGTGVSFLYLGNLIFRLMHNVLFTCMRPRQRVLLAYFFMFVAHSTLATVYYVVESKSVAWVYFAYLLSGVAIGSFESNLISCLTPLGHGTKMWAVLGIPTGFNFVSIGSFIAFAISPADLNLQMGVYYFIAAANLCGLLFMWLVVPNIEFEATNDTVLVFFKDIKKWREWVPLIWKYCFSLFIDMFAVSVFSSIGLYLYDLDEVPLYPFAKKTIPKNAFLTWYYIFSFSGDFISRRVAYYDKARNPILYLICTVVGMILVLSKTACIAPVGMFLVMFANGSVYAQTTKHVDNCVPKKFNLIALSCWLFLGDVGSFIGAQTVQPIQGVLGPIPNATDTDYW